MTAAKVTPLYVVTHSPKRGYRDAFAVRVWFTTANSKTHARELYAELLPAGAAAYYYKKPEAHLVVQGGDPIKV
jgi:hypothetical protein